MQIMESSIQLDEGHYCFDSLLRLKMSSCQITTASQNSVSKRVAVIRNETDVVQWRHIGTRLNPADETSRGLSAKEFLACERWLKGTEFHLRGKWNGLKPSWNNL